MPNSGGKYTATPLLIAASPTASLNSCEVAPNKFTTASTPWNAFVNDVAGVRCCCVSAFVGVDSEKLITLPKKANVQ